MTYQYNNYSKLASIYRGILVAIVAFPAFGCGPLQCTEEGCSNAVQLTLKAPLPPGEYRLTVTRDGETESCTVQVPEESSTERPEGCDIEGVRIDTDDIDVDRNPATLGVALEHLASGETVSKEYEVEYSVVSPNGEKCGPTCRIAELTLDTSALVSAINDYDSSGLGGAGGMSSSP